MSVKSFQIHQAIWNPSDHTPISVDIELKVDNDCIGVKASHDILYDHSSSNVRRAKRINSVLINWNTYSIITEKDFDTYAGKIHDLELNKSLMNMNNAVNFLSNSLYKAATTLSPVRSVNHELNNDTPLSRADDILVRFQQEQCNEEEWKKVNKEMITHLKYSVAEKERRMWSSLLLEKDTKALWNKISWRGTFEHITESNKPTLDELSEHFQKKSQCNEKSTLLSEVTGNNYVEELDHEISIEEIEHAQKRLKEDKATSDGWVKQMILNIPLRILFAIHMIFNTILLFHIYPTKWRTTIVNELFKNKGESRHAKNYRPISLVQLLCKLFDFILTKRFTKWFTPSDSQTAYQTGKSTVDHVFLLRCLVQQAKRQRQTLYVIAADFDGAFDRISRSVLIRKLVLFGAGTIFTSCIASMYMCTENVIFRGKEHVTYDLFSGIKQGLPLSPMLFIFYINDIFDLFDGIYGRALDNLYKLVHILVHADDVTLIATNRENAIAKLRTLSYYCNLNHIIPQFSKCEFLTVNGVNNIDNVPLPFGDSFLKHVDKITILGSHISASGLLNDDLELHMMKRYPSCIKFYNFCRENKLAPISIKIKVLKACVVNSLLYNCETFGNKVPKNLEKIYHKLLRCAFNIRGNTPILILYIESGLLPIKALIEARQFKFFKRFPSTIAALSSRHHLLEALTSDPSAYLKHYIQLSEKYERHYEIYKFYDNKVKNDIRNFAANERYKYSIYLQINPDLVRAPFLKCLHPTTMDIIRFRLGSHKLPIETGRWNRTPRELRHCTTCNVLGDERHFIYNCPLIERSDLNLSNNLSQIWSQEDVFELFGRLKKAEYL